MLSQSITDKLFQEKNYIDKNFVCFIKKGPFLDTLNYICRRGGLGDDRRDYGHAGMKACIPKYKKDSLNFRLSLHKIFVSIYNENIDGYRGCLNSEIRMTST